MNNHTITQSYVTESLLPVNESSARTGGSEGVPLLDQSPLETAVYTVAYLCVFLLALINNSAVLTVIRLNPRMNTVTNLFLANLAVADLIVSFIVLPITLLSNIFTEWLFSRILCKAVPYLQAVAVGASVNTLTAVAVERFCVIFFPAKTIIKPRRAAIVILFIWLIPLCIQTPWVYLYQLTTFKTPRGPLQACYLDTRNLPFVRGFFLGVVFLTCYLIPLLSITIFYLFIGIKVYRRDVAGIGGSKASRNIQASKMRVVRMLITVAAVFAISWLPLYCLQLRVLFGGPLDPRYSPMIKQYLRPVFQWLGSANSCVNPFIYCFFSHQFRASIATVLRRICSPILPKCILDEETDGKNHWPAPTAIGETRLTRSEVRLTPVCRPHDRPEIIDLPSNI